MSSSFGREAFRGEHLVATGEWDKTVNVGITDPQDTLLMIQDARKSRTMPAKFKPNERWDSVAEMGLNASFEMHSRLVYMVRNFVNGASITVDIDVQHETQMAEETTMTTRAKKMGVRRLVTPGKDYF